jgi:hypothetical protein
MLNTKQNEFIIAVRVVHICHYATYFWQIDDDTGGGHTRKVGMIRTVAGYYRDRVSRRGDTHPRMGSDLSTRPVLAAGKRAATTGTVRRKALRTRESFIQRTGGGDVSMVTFRCMLRASE